MSKFLLGLSVVGMKMFSHRSKVIAFIPFLKKKGFAKTGVKRTGTYNVGMYKSSCAS